MNKIAVIGGGMVGSLIYHELSKQNDVALFDRNQEAHNGQAKAFDVLTSELSPLLHFDMLVLAVPGSIGYRALKRLIPLGKNIIDISFFPEDPSLLDSELKRHGNYLVYDCGVAPGFDNVALGYYANKLDVKSFKCMVGGLPLEKNPPFNYKAPFSPSDVIEEYVRPARFRRKGKDIIMEALTEVETVEHSNYGSLEAFNSDGLRSLLISFPNIPNMVEKTLRYPGHARQMEFLREAGFFDKDMLVETSKKLFEAWNLKDSDPEFTLMQIDIDGEQESVHIELSAERNEEGWSSMTQTTAYNCTAAVEWLLKNPKLNPGLHAPEKLGEQKKYWEFLLGYLTKRNIEICLEEIKE